MFFWMSATNNRQPKQTAQRFCRKHEKESQTCHSITKLKSKAMEDLSQSQFPQNPYETIEGLYSVYTKSLELRQTTNLGCQAQDHKTADNSHWLN